MIEQAKKLGPWHHGIPLGTGFTGDWQEHKPQKCFAHFKQRVLDFWEVKPSHRFLDLGCNAGGYCFAAVDAGFDRAFGIEARTHWYNQAMFCRNLRPAWKERTQFHLGRVDVGRPHWGLFEVVFAKGILYHLFDPMEFLKWIASINTGYLFCETCITENKQNKGALHLTYEDENLNLSGMEPLCWVPDGHKVVMHMLRYVGYREVEALELPGLESNRICVWGRK